MDQPKARLVITVEGIDAVEAQGLYAQSVPAVVTTVTSAAEPTIRCYSVRELAGQLGYSEDYIRDLAATGVLPGRKPGGKGGKLLFWHDEIVDWLRAQPLGVAGTED